MGSRELHQMKLIFKDDGTLEPNQVKVRRYSCICEGCRRGLECQQNWAINEWRTERLELDPIRVERNIELIPIDDDFIVL